MKPLAEVLCNLGVKRAMVVFGQDRLDEISMSAPTTVCEVKDNSFTSYEISPEDFGYARCTKEALVGGAPQDNAKITLSILRGDKGSCRDAVCLNAGAGLYVAGKANTLTEGIRLAEEVIDSGKAMKKLEEFIARSQVEG